MAEIYGVAMEVPDISVMPPPDFSEVIYTPGAEISTSLLGRTLLKQRMSDLDAKLLRELTINAKIQVTELSKIYGKNKSMISRRIKSLKENVISRGILKFNRESFGLNYYQLIRTRVPKSKEKEFNLFKIFVDSTDLAILLRISFTDNEFVLYSVGSPRLSNEITSLVWEFCDPAYFKVYQINTRSFMNYYFYHENYSHEDGWKINEDYYRNEPISIITK